MFWKQPYLRLLLQSFGVSATLTGVWCFIARRLNWHDQNPTRKANLKPSLRPLTSGGVALYATFWLVFAYYRPTLILTPYYGGIWLASTLIVITGLIDDRVNLNGLQKTLAIIGAASVIYFQSGVVFKTVLIPFEIWGLDYCLTVGWIFLVTNAINLLDGVDGLASSITLVSFTIMALVAGYFSLSVPVILVAMLAILMGAVLGFLPYNWFPAKLYLGDTGALFLGFMYGVLSVTRLKNATFYTLALPILMFMVPLFDTFYATMRRIIMGQSIVMADQDHLHHRLLRRGLSVRQVVFVMTGISFMFGLLAILTQTFKAYRHYVLFGSSLAVLGLFVWMRWLKQSS